MAIMTSSTSLGSCMHDQMLESNRDDVKLEAMRCVTVMTAKGKLSVPRTLFPHIVKNVSSKNPELRKLIYLYLTNFADQEPDLALLPVATLQKSLKSPNPLVRSSALKVLTSMRLGILSAILMATLRNSVNDLSPYVRKTVAHSIIKIYRLDPALRPDLLEYIERLFEDKNSMVLSSAVAAFEVVCPDKLELVHKHFRRFCFILADCNEWGQTLLLNLLSRYAVKTFSSPTRDKISNFNPSEHDPKILLRSAKTLVHSNNAAVVMAVIKLFIDIANHNEVRSTITRPLIRLLNNRREIQLMVLKTIEDLTTIKHDSGNVDEEIQHVVDSGPPSLSSEKEAPKAEAKITEEESSVEVPKEDVQEKSLTRNGYISLDDGAGVSNDEQNNVEGETELEEKVAESECEETSKDAEDEKVSDGDEENGEEYEEEEYETEEDEEYETEEDEDDSDDESDDDDEEVMANNTSNNENHKTEQCSESDKELDDKLKEFDINSKEFKANKDPAAFREVFRPYTKSFFVKHTDCTQVRLAKLRILTNLSSSVNVSLILRELQAYIATYVDDKEFVSAAIHAIGRCAIIVKEVAQTCLNGLTSLLSNNNEHVVSETIVVLRSQIMNKRTTSKSFKVRQIERDLQREKGETEKQTDEKAAGDQDGKSDNEFSADGECNEEDDDKIVSTVIKQVTKLLPMVTAPQARATILWVLAEFCDKNLTAAKCAPNVLRLIAKSFCQEDNFVKLQALTLASKFLLSLDKDKKPQLYQFIQALSGYLFSLAKYDVNHDVRDRGRFLKKLLEDEELCARVLNGTQQSDRFAIKSI